jgi:hypothetical protein
VPVIGIPDGSYTPFSSVYVKDVTGTGTGVAFAEVARANVAARQKTRDLRLIPIPPNRF